MQKFFFLIATASIAILLMITIFLFMEGVPIFGKVSVTDFIFGKYWVGLMKGYCSGSVCRHVS